MCAQADNSTVRNRELRKKPHSFSTCLLQGRTQILRVKGSSQSLRAELTCGSVEGIFERLGSSPVGLTSVEARARLAQFGANRLRTRSRAAGFALLIRQFKSPIILILIGAAILSMFLSDPSDAVIILTIVLVSGSWVSGRSTAQ